TRSRIWSIASIDVESPNAVIEHQRAGWRRDPWSAVDTRSDPTGRDSPPARCHSQRQDPELFALNAAPRLYSNELSKNEGPERRIIGGACLRQIERHVAFGTKLDPLMRIAIECQLADH